MTIKELLKRMCENHPPGLDPCLQAVTFRVVNEGGFTAVTIECSTAGETSSKRSSSSHDYFWKEYTDEQIDWDVSEVFMRAHDKAIEEWRKNRSQEQS